jgi:hypothetical protein
MSLDRNADSLDRLRRNQQRLKAGNASGMVFNETPTGTINGTNAAFVLGSRPHTGSLLLYVNGLLMLEGGDFTISGKTVTFLAGAVPEAGDWIRATYLKG